MPGGFLVLSLKASAVNNATLFHRLLDQAIPHCTAESVALWPCEDYNSRHFETIAAEGRWRVCVRTEIDYNCSRDYETPPPLGTEWIILLVELQDNWGKCWQREALAAIETPGTRNVPSADWQHCHFYIANTAAELVRKLLYSPIGLISNIRGEIAEREQMINELAEVRTAASV